MKTNNILITICARGGSKGLKNKNILPLSGVPLIAHTILQAKSWNRTQHIVVSTDSEEIAKISRDYGACVPFIRNKVLSKDTTAKVPVIADAMSRCEEIYATRYDIVVDLDVTSPIRQVQDIENMYNIYIKTKPTTLFSVVKSKKSPYYNMVELDKKGKAHLSKNTAKHYHTRQSCPDVYSLNASIYFYNPEFLKNNPTASVINDHTRVYVMPEISGVDIDSEIDFKFIEFLVNNRYVKFKNT